MKKSIFIMMFISLFTKAIGFLREILMSYFYGTSIVKDAYVTAVTIPMIIVGFIVVGITSSFIPIYNEIKEKSEEESRYFMNNLINILMVIFTIVLLIALIFTNSIVDIFAYGYSGEQKLLAIKFTKILILTIYSGVLTGIFKGFMNVNKNFNIPLISVLFLNIILIVSIYISSKFGAIYLVIGTLLAYYLQYIFYVPYLRKYGFRYKFIFNLKSDNIYKLIKMAIPIFIGTAVIDISNIIDKSMASGLVRVGGVSALDYSYKLVMMVTGIVIVSFATYVYPRLSKLGNKKDLEGIKKLSIDTISSIYILVIPIAIAMYVYAEPIVILLFKRGEFNDKSVILVSELFRFYSLYLFGQVIIEVITRTYYSLNNSKTPAKISFIMICLGIVLNIILAKLIGLKGLSLATSVTTNFNALLLVYTFIKSYGKFDYSRNIKLILKVILATVIVLAISQVMYIILPKNNNIFLLNMLISGIIYTIGLFIFKILDIKTIKLLRKKNKE